jgi:hypothetical protein
LIGRIRVAEIARRLAHGRVSSADMRGILNIVIGVIFIIGGLTGHLALIGTHSGPGLAIVGVVLVVVGLLRVLRRA